MKTCGKHRALLKKISLSISMLFILLQFSSCEMEKQHIATLWTNRPEIALYVEQFNSLHDEYKIKLLYRQNPGQSLLKEAEKPDIIISEYLNDSRTMAFFSPLDALFDEELIRHANFYPELLELGRKKDQQLLFPISFNLPGFITLKEAMEEESFLLPLETLKEKSIAFMAESEHEAMGFSPRWEPRSLLTIAGLMQAYFQENSENFISWDSTALDKSLKIINEWIEALHDSPEKEAELTERFMHDPPYKLLTQKRIFAYYYTAVDYSRLPGNIRNKLDIRWITGNSVIPVEENILFTGIVQDSTSLKTAQTFLIWFFQPATQKELLQLTQYKRDRTFGIGNGFSALRPITEGEIPLTYPYLAGRIPQPEYLNFPSPLPITWEKIKSDVIIPWLNKQTSISPGETTLDEELKTWFQQNPTR